MSDPQTFADLLIEFQEKYDEFQDSFFEATGNIVDMLNGAARSFAQFLDDIWPGFNEVEHAIDKWNDELRPALQEGIAEINRQVGSAVNQLAGNPLNLQIWAENYVTAQGLIFTQRNFVDVAGDVEGAWSGVAFDKYSQVASVQHDNLEVLGEALSEGGMLTSAAAHKILELWRQLLAEFASFTTDILRILASATDASKILSLEIPTVLEAIAAVWQKVVDIADILLEFMTSQATTDTLNWLALAGTSGGLAGNEWPAISESASDRINDPANWTPTG